MSDRRLAAASLALATAVAAALRLPFLGTQSLWFDETYTAHVVASSLGALWDRVGATESTPPLYYLACWAWVHAFGSEGEGALRAVSALALIAAVPVAFFALRRLAGARTALAVAALLAVSPLMSWYALDARAYGLLVLVGLLSVWACAAALEAPSPRRLALWALAAAAAIWTHWFAGFLVLGELVALLWLAPGARRATLLAAGVAGVALLPLVGLLREQTGDERAGFIAFESLADRGEQLVRQFGSGPNVPRTWLEAAMLAAFLIGAFWTVVAARPQGRTLAVGVRALLAIGAVGLLMPLALAALGVYDRFNVRNVLYLWPLAAALAAPALLRLRGAPLAALLALGAVTTAWTQTDWRFQNADWRSAIERVAQSERVAARAPAARPLVAVTTLGQPVAARYLGRPPTAAPLATRSAWLLVEPQRSPGRRDLHEADAAVVAQLLAAFPDHRETRLHGFRLIELRTPAAVPLDPAALPGATLFPAVRSASG